MGVIYYLAGADGSGKTTYLSEIECELKKKGLTTKHIWLRSPKIFSKPLMAFCRLTGFTKYEVINGIKYGVHEFYRSKIISFIYPYLQLVDFNLKWLWLKKDIKKYDVLLFDRFALDTLADLMVDTHKYDLHRTGVGKKFIKKVPKGTRILILTTSDSSIIRNRKKDTLYDPRLDIKLKVYNILAEELNLTLINNDNEKEIVRKNIFDKLGLNGRD